MALREEKKERTAAAIQDAALDLFTARGYDAVTLADVAAAAGVAERTLYRYVPDKQELLFREDAAWQQALAEALTARPAGESPLDAVLATARALAQELQPRRAELRARRAVIAAAPALAAREAVKQAGWADRIEVVLRSRGVGAREARLTARVSAVAFEDAISRWLAPERPRRGLDAELVATWAALEGLLAGSAGAGPGG